MFGLTPDEEVVVLQRKRTRDAFNVLKHVASCQKNGATCQETLTALAIPHEVGSPRFRELERAGCLQQTKRKRKTRSGASAYVYVACEGALFLSYLTLGRMPSKAKVQGLSTREQAILDASLDFLKRWKTAKTKKGQQGALTDLVGRLCVADELPPV